MNCNYTTDFSKTKLATTALPAATLTGSKQTAVGSFDFPTLNATKSPQAELHLRRKAAIDAQRGVLLLARLRKMFW